MPIYTVEEQVTVSHVKLIELKFSLLSFLQTHKIKMNKIVQKPGAIAFDEKGYQFSGLILI